MSYSTILAALTWISRKTKLAQTTHLIIYSLPEYVRNTSSSWASTFDKEIADYLNYADTQSLVPLAI